MSLEVEVSTRQTDTAARRSVRFAEPSSLLRVETESPPTAEGSLRTPLSGLGDDDNPSSDISPSTRERYTPCGGDDDEDLNGTRGSLRAASSNLSFCSQSTFVDRGPACDGTTPLLKSSSSSSGRGALEQYSLAVASVKQHQYKSIRCLLAADDGGIEEVCELADESPQSAA